MSSEVKYHFHQASAKLMESKVFSVAVPCGGLSKELKTSVFGEADPACDKMTQEQYAHRNNVSQEPHVYKVGIYGWRKRCLYLFVLLLMVLILVNLALTIWILKVMNFTIGSPLFLQSSKNVTVNILNSKNNVVTRLVAGSNGIEAHSKLLEVKSNTGKVLFSADEREVVVGADRLRVLGAEGAVFSNSVETPHIRADPFKELRLESPTRSLFMEAPKGVEINAEAGNLQATCRNEMKLESKDGEISLDANNIKLPRLPMGTFSAAGAKQKVFEVCVCPNGRLFLSPRDRSTCQISSSVCL
ncbi:delta-sarcoglycan-like [Acipenser oxyrinchus oxyrinchus]|uniref:Delta-sarcoglycan-like n=1 Tax=Acipenser oxyrinchus oxyrinchus TaxID=40147 RepID=A0AAD8FZU6_ACIOX|nr:delta-sarcoglycan-like [Acipenser oxyrinchus oxyrinchus]